MLRIYLVLKDVFIFVDVNIIDLRYFLFIMNFLIGICELLKDNCYSSLRIGILVCV